MTCTHFAKKTLILAIGMTALPASAISWDGNGDGSTWNDPVNWLGNVMPTSADTATIGNLAAIENGFLNINMNDTLAGLTISDGMRLDTNGYTLLVNGDTLLTGQNSVGNVLYSSGLVVDRGAGADDFDTNNLTLTNLASLTLVNGGIVEVDNVLSVGAGSRVRGGGVIRLVQGSGTVFNNNGTLDPTTDGMTITASGNGLINLDGTSETGSVQASASRIDGTGFDHLTINAKGLTDAFDGEISITANGFIDMNLADGWTLGGGGEIHMYGNSSHPGFTEVRGGNLTTYGTVYVGSGPAQGRFTGNVAAMTGSTFEVGLDDTLTFDGATNSFTGATFELEDGASVNVKGNTTVQSATFDFADPADGIVEFHGPTIYSYNTTINSNGVVQQTGDATVVGSMVVNGGIFDLDGAFGTTTISLGNGANNGSMTLNVDAIDNTSKIYNGTLNTANAGLTGGLTVNLPGNEVWSMAGVLNLAGAGNLYNPTRIAGSRMYVTGTINLSNNSPVNIAADMNLTNTAVLNTQANGRLSVSGQTVVSSDATFNGTGTLRNTGTLQLTNGVNMNDVKLVNAGTLAVGNSPGTAVVPEYDQTAGGTWEVEIGGANPGMQHDRLNVAGTATLAGEIDLSLINAFDPALLQQFTVLSSFNRVDYFDTVAGVIYAPGKALAVTYTTTDVLVTATIPGDTDLDGDVDDTDLGTAFANYTGPMGASGGKQWASGDSDGDGDVDDSDLGTSFAYYTGPLAPAAAVPEPGSLALLGIAGLALIRRRRS